MTEPVFTTGEVGKIVGVNFRTVIRWIERGELEGYKLPGRGDHRVTQSNLTSFMERNNIPIPERLQRRQRKALVVDDDEPMANAIARVLRRIGWEVEVATDGFEAGVILERTKPTLMTLDLKMPYMDGFKVLNIARGLSGMKDLKVIVISAQSDAELDRAIEEGADDILAKPFENDELVDKVGNLVD